MGKSKATFEETEKEPKKTTEENFVMENHTFSQFRRLIRKMKRGLSIYKTAKRVLARLRKPRFSINPLKTKPKTKPLASQLKASPNGHKSASSHAQPLTFKEFYPVTAPFGYVGVKVEKARANGSSVAFDGISNPDWLHTNANGEYTVTLQSKNVAGETFILYFTSGNLVAQKRITQEPR